MRLRRLCGLCLALLLAGLPALARPLAEESPAPQPSFLIRLCEVARELFPLLAASEVPSPADGGAESSSGEDDPDLGLGMDPNG